MKQTAITALVFSLTLGYLGIGLGQTPAPAKGNQYFVGKVVPLTTILKLSGAKIDADFAAQSYALLADDGKIHMLLKDDGSRMFFKDKRLLDRPMRLTGKLLPGSQLLQVTDVHSLKDGKLHEVYYWCEKCQLRFTEAGNCICCGAVTELIEEPVRSKSK